MGRLTLDFETRSACDLKKAGAWVYSEHPTTEVLCLWFCATDGKTRLWRPGDPEPAWFRPFLAAGGVMEAHSVLFERGIWTNIMVPRYGWPEVPPEQWHDTMAMCARKSLPLDLDKASRLLDLPVVKDDEGKRALMKICKPTGKTKTFNEDPALLARVIAYGETDTKAQMHLSRRLGRLEPQEKRIWDLNQRMNLRGLRIDMAFVADCQAVIDAATPAVAERFEALVGCNATQRDKVLAWVNERGAGLPDLTKETVTAALAGEMPEEVRQALELRSALTSASIKKLAAMRACAGRDGRARGLVQYHAATTGRDGGRLLQPQNFPRGSVEGGKDEDGEDVPAWDVLVPAIQERDPAFLGDLFAKQVKGVSEELRPVLAPFQAVASALRHCIIAGEGRRLVSGDFSTIEVRVVLALAGQHDKVRLIAEGGDPYCDMATQIHGFKVNKKEHPKQRQDGKAAVLGLGFGMGARKFRDKDFKDKDLDYVQRIVDLYRTEWAPAAPKMWRGLQDAALRTVIDRRPHEYNGIVYALEDEWMTCLLPSGRKLYYFRPRRVKRKMPWHTDEQPDIRDAWTYVAMKQGRLVEVDAYGGLLTENVVQATARDILYCRALAADEAGFPLVLTVHDEAVTEPEAARADWPALQQIMEESDPWVKAAGIPVASEGWVGDRYRK